MKNGINLVIPIPIGGVDPKPFEEISPPEEEILQRRDHQRLAEAARPRQITDAIGFRAGEIVQLRRFIDVDIIVLRIPQNRKIKVGRID